MACQLQMSNGRSFGLMINKAFANSEGLAHIMIPQQELSKGHKFKVSGESQFKGKA
jgi:hypothetical protein